MGPATARRPVWSSRRSQVLLVLALVLAPVVVGCGVDPTAPADGDSLEELVERLEAADGVTEVDAEEAQGESDSGEPGRGAGLDVEMVQGASAPQVALVLARITEQGSLAEVEVTLGDTATTRTLAEGGSSTIYGVEDGADTDAGARVLVAATALVRDSFAGRGRVAVSFDADAPGEPQLTLILPTRDDARVTEVARGVEADPQLTDVEVVISSTLPRSDGDLGFGPSAGSPSLASGPGGLTPEVLDGWDRVRAATELVDDRVRAFAEYVHRLSDGTTRVGADVELPGAPRRRDATYERYGRLVDPMLRAHLDLLAGRAAGSAYVLALDGDVLVDVGTGAGVDRVDSYGRADWDRAAQRYLGRIGAPGARQDETRSRGPRAGS